MKALAEADPGTALPAPGRPAVDNTPRRFEAGVAEPVVVPARPARIAPLRFTVVAAPSERALRNTLIAWERPDGLTTLARCRVRYLIGSAHGWLGAAGFSAAVLRWAVRDR